MNTYFLKCRTITFKTLQEAPLRQEFQCLNGYEEMWGLTKTESYPSTQSKRQLAEEAKLTTWRILFSVSNTVQSWGTRKNLMWREQRTSCLTHTLKNTSSHRSYCVLSGPHITEPYTCTLYTLADKNTPTQTDTFIFYLYTHHSYKRTDCKHVNSKESSQAQGCGEQSLRLLHHTHTHTHRS